MIIAIPLATYFLEAKRRDVIHPGLGLELIHSFESWLTKKRVHQFATIDRERLWATPSRLDGTEIKVRVHEPKIGSKWSLSISCNENNTSVTWKITLFLLIK